MSCQATIRALFAVSFFFVAELFDLFGVVDFASVTAASIVFFLLVEDWSVSMFVFRLELFFGGIDFVRAEG